MRTIIAPSTYRKYEKALERMRIEYRAVRRAALEAGIAWRRDPTGHNQLAREDAVGDAVVARIALRNAEHHLAFGFEVIAGGNLSPNELARRAALRRNHRDEKKADT